MEELFLFIIPLLARLIYDWYKIRKKEEPISSPGYVKRNLALGGLIIGLAVIAKAIWPDPPLWTGVTYQLGLFLIFFDYAINLLMGKHWAYVSTTNNSTWDKLRGKVDWVRELMIKLIVGASGIAVYYQYHLL